MNPFTTLTITLTTVMLLLTAFLGGTSPAQAGQSVCQVLRDANSGCPTTDELPPISVCQVL